MSPSTSSRFASARIVAWVFAAVFVVTTVIGFVPNPVVGKGALFVTNAAHNLVHLATAIGFAIVASIGDRASAGFMKAFGAVYLMVGILGFITLGSAAETHLLGLIHINQLDNFLHVGLASVIAAAGFLTSVERPRPAAA